MAVGGVEIALDKVWINTSDFTALFDILLMSCCVAMLMGALIECGCEILFH